uniref:Major facilitator superfamily domain-containing protein 8-like n=1 Tax=Hirondellea gigas TaxID=1518452 RepID=A0A2P2I225_9CRUS
MKSHNYVQSVGNPDDENSNISSPLTPSQSSSFPNTVSTSMEHVTVADNNMRPGSAASRDSAVSFQPSDEPNHVATDNILSVGDDDKHPSQSNNDAMLPSTETDHLQTVTTSEVLETAEEKRLRKQSHRIIYVTAFIMSVGFSIILTSVWPYLKQLDPSASKVFYGFVIGINPFGQLLASPFLGWCGNKVGSNRFAFLVSILFFVLGNVTYALLRLMDRSVVSYFLMASRFIVGVGSANIAVCRSYLTTSTTIAERSTVLSYVAAAQSIGLILGPAIQTALAIAIPVEAAGNNSTLSTTDADGRPTGVWDLYTAVGWIAALLGLANMLLFMPCIYKEVNISQREAELILHNSKNASAKYPRPDYFAILVLLVNFFFILFVYVLLETIIVPMGKDLYGWSSEFAIKAVGIGLSVIGVLAFFMFFVCTVLCKKFDERKVYMFVGILPLIIAMSIHFPMGHNYPLMQNCSQSVNNASYVTTSTATTSLFLTATDLYSTTEMPVLDRNKRFFSPVDEQQPVQFFTSFSRSKRAAILDDDDSCNANGCPVKQHWCTYTPIIEIPQLIVGNLFGVMGYPIAFTLTSSIFSKMIGPKNQGFWMGVLTSTGSLSRMSGPIFVTLIYSNYGTRWTFGALTAVLIISMILSVIFYKRLVPMNVNKNSPEDERMTQET